MSCPACEAEDYKVITLSLDAESREKLGVKTISFKQCTNCHCNYGWTSTQINRVQGDENEGTNQQTKH